MPRLLLGSFLILTVCAAPPAGARPSTPDAGQTYAATDGIGQAFSFDEPVQRVVCLHAICAEVLSDLGLLPVATLDYGEFNGRPMIYGERAGEIPVLAAYDSVEEVASYEPDLIITGSTRAADLVPAMRVVAPTYAAAAYTGPDDHEANLRGIGALTGRSAEAEAAIARFAAVVAAVAKRAPPGAADLRVLFVHGYAADSYTVQLGPSPMCQVLQRNGLGRCVFDRGADPTSGEVGAEAVLEADPDLIGYINNGPDPSERADPVWPRLTAVQNGRVYLDNSDGLYCCGLRQQQYALELYAHHAFPQAGFPDPGPAETYDPTDPANPRGGEPAATPSP